MIEQSMTWAKKGIIIVFIALLVSFCGNDEEEVGASGITIHENNRVTSLVMSSQEYADWKASRGATSRDLASTFIYEKFKDDFDFIALILNEDSAPPGWVPGSLASTSNDVRNIGREEFDNTALYGSSGRLKGVLFLATRESLMRGPSLHELAHQWANYLIPTESPRLPNNLGPHWGVSGGNTRGQLGGFRQGSLRSGPPNFDFTVDQFGPNANGGNGIPFNQIELYLMGLIPLSDVSSFDVFTDITNREAMIDQNTGKVSVSYAASTKTTYTSNKIRTDFGERIPSVSNSQKDFKLLMMALSDRSLTEEEWNTLDSHAEQFERNGDNGSPSNFNFWEATGGRGTIELGNLQNSIK